MNWRFTLLAFVFIMVLAQFSYINRYGLLFSWGSVQLNVLVLSYQRSGSSFLGELLSSCEDCSYFFEPLFYDEHIRQKPSVNAYLNTLAGVFSCDNLTLTHLQSSETFWIVRKFGEYYNIFNTSDINLEEYCTRNKIKVTKTIRMRLSQMKPLLNDFYNLKIIHLIRDPRGALNSVWKQPTHWSETNQSPSQFCINLDNDIKAGEKLSKERYYLIRYENLILHPLEELKKIFEFLNHPITPKVKSFLLQHSKAETDAIAKKEAEFYYSTFRESNFDPFAWKVELSNREKRKIEYSCRKILTKLNYLHPSVK